MKNFVIATVSAVALLGTAVYAENRSAPMMKESNPAHEMPAHERAAGNETCPPHHKKHHAHHKHKKHHHRHVDRGHRGHPLAVYVNYPPLNVAAFSACGCEYYQGNQAFGYIYHEGYYWYPQLRGDMLIGYEPYNMQGYYWYPSRLHPHAVYVDRQSPLHPSLYPVPMEMASMGAGSAHKHHRHLRHHAHHGARHHGHHAAKRHAQAHPASMNAPMGAQQGAQPAAPATMPNPTPKM